MSENNTPTALKGFGVKTIKSIQLQDGQRIIDQKKILEEIKNFYSSYFSEKKTQDQNLDTLFKETHVRKLSLSE